MPVTIKQLRVKEVQKGKQKLDSELAFKVDRAAQLKNFLDSVSEQEKEYNGLVKEFRTLAQDVAPEQEVKFEGDKHMLVLSECPSQRTLLSNVDVVKLLGEKVFMQIAKVTLGDLEKYLTPEELAKICKTERSGTRRAKFISKDAAKEA